MSFEREAQLVGVADIQGQEEAETVSLEDPRGVDTQPQDRAEVGAHGNLLKSPA